MRYYMAPLEGITGYVYRNAYHACFEPMDKYFIPFLTPNQKGKFSSRERNDILPEHNIGMNAVPQILTNKAEDFIYTARQLQELGYGEMNLNLGCPSKTVVTKYRGSGFLAKQEELDQFLEEIFENLDMRISIKTRIGKLHPEEFEELLEIYNKYPMEEVIIHPRVQQDFYKNQPNLDVFEMALKKSRNPICYNGDLVRTKRQEVESELYEGLDMETFVEKFPQVDCVMLGRGILRNPGLVGCMKGKKMPDKEKIREFHDRLYEGYQEISSGDKNVLFKMKEVWVYMGELFTDAKPYLKKVKKSERLSSYEDAVNALFAEQRIIEE